MMCNPFGVKKQTVSIVRKTTSKIAGVLEKKIAAS